MMMVSNTIHIKKGFADKVIEGFKQPKGIQNFAGFIRMEVLKTEGIEEHDEIKVCTFWENREAFEAWTNSNSFKQAHERRQKQPEEKKGEQIMLGSKMTMHDVVVAHQRANQ